ncbi:hypothetical protein JW868_02650 [Candidatus Woesearchaeota archaeon]|nr:hypothetical protein [Candidatus Woesearchaeota archaeon]
MFGSRPTKLEESVLDKITPVIDYVMTKFMGSPMSELTYDISEKLRRSDLLGIPVNTMMPFKMAKRLFRSEYLQRLLIQNQGNISRVAEISRVDRRSIHRIVRQSRVDAYTIRKEMTRPTYLQMRAVSHAVEESIDEFRDHISPTRVQYLYSNIDELSEEILEGLPGQSVSLKDAVEEFETLYFGDLLAECNGVISAVAKRCGLRYETVHRKLKELGLK